jgi:hypothetical protein
LRSSGSTDLGSPSPAVAGTQFDASARGPTNAFDIGARPPRLTRTQIDASAHVGAGSRSPGSTDLGSPSPALAGRQIDASARDRVGALDIAAGLTRTHIDASAHVGAAESPSGSSELGASNVHRDGDPALRARLDGIHAFDAVNHRIARNGAPANANAESLVEPAYRTQPAHGPAVLETGAGFEQVAHLGPEAAPVARLAKEANLRTLDPRARAEADDPHAAAGAAAAKALGQQTPTYDPHAAHPPPAPQPGAHAAGHAPAPRPPPMPPAPVSKGQAAVNAYIDQARKDRDAAKAKVHGEQVARCVQVSVDGHAIEIATRATNDRELARLRKEAEADKQRAAKEAEARKQHEGPVTIASLTAKLEATATADKQQLKATFERKQSELKIRLETQKQTLKAETDRQVENVKHEADARKLAAENAWKAEKANLEAANGKLMEQMRAQVVDDQKRLEADKQKLWDATNQRLAQIDHTATRDAAKVIATGEASAKALIAKADTDGKTQVSSAHGRAAQIRTSGYAKAAGSSDEAALKARADQAAAAEQAKGQRLAEDLKIKAELGAKQLRADAKQQSDGVIDAGKKARTAAETAASSQVEAIATKITGLKALGDQKIKQAGDALATKLTEGQAKLAAKLQGGEDKIAQIQKDGQAKLAKLETDTGKDLQKDYDAEVRAIDQRLDIARKQLAAGSASNIKALERLVDQACAAIDKSVVATERKFDAHIADAERKAQALVIAQLKKVKAEADKALQEIDKSFAAAMKAVDDAVEATYRTLEDTAKGKMLEVEVHIATLLGDTGDDSRLTAVKAQLADYIKKGQKIPAGYGETARPEPPSEAKPGKDAKPADKTDEKAAEAAKPDEDAKRKAELLDPKNLSEEGIAAKVQQQLKKGQAATGASAAETAHNDVKAAGKAANDAVEHTFQTKLQGLSDLQSSDPEIARKAGEEVQKLRSDRETSQKRAEDMAKAAERDGWLSKDPDKKAMLRSLEGMDEQQVALMREALKHRSPPIDLDALLKDKLGGDDLTEAKIRLQGDPIMADIQTLQLRGGHHVTGNEQLLAGGYLQMGALLAGRDAANLNIGADDERIKQILDRYKDQPGQSGKSMKEFAEAYEKATGKPLSGYLSATGNAELTRELGIPVREPDTGTASEIKARAKAEQDRLIAEAQQGGKPIDAAKLGPSMVKLQSALEGLHLDSTRGDMVKEALEGKSPEEIRVLKAMYKAQTGRDLDTLIESRVQGPALAEAKATMRGDKTEAAMQRILGAEGASLLPGTLDDKKLQDVLRELKDPAERRAVLDAYRKRTGQDLSATIAEKMTGNDRKLAQALADGDALKARMIEMDEATNGGWMNSMHDAIEERTGLHTQKYTRAIAQAAMGGVAMLAAGDHTVVVGGYELGNGSIHKVDSDKILDLLEQTPNPADRQRLKDLYKQQTGRDMDDDMAKKLVDPTGNRAKLDAYHALQEGRTADAAAARMEQALDGVNDTKAFYKQLEGKPEWQRQQIIAAYNQRHPDDPNAFVNLVGSQLGGLDGEKANRLAFGKDDAATGAVKLPDAFVLRYAQDSVWTKTAKFIDDKTAFVDKYPMLYAVPFLGQGLAEAKVASYFMRGWGVDDAAIKDVLKDKSKEEIDELKRQYPGLETDLKYVLSGRSAYEVELMLSEGAPQTPQDKARRALDLYDFDRGARGEWIPGFHNISNAIVDVIEPSGKTMDAQAEQLRALASNPNLSSAQQHELESALAMMDASTSSFLEAREAVTGAIATAAGAVVGAAVTLLTGGVAGAVIAALATGLTTVAVKTAMLGQAYGRNELGVDLAMMAVQAATGGLGVAAGAQSFLGQVLTGAISNAASQFVSTAITSKDAHDLLSLLTQASKAGLVGALSGGVGAAATAALGGAMEKLSEKAFGQGASILGKAVKGFVTGGGSAVASMLAEAAVNPEMLSGNWDAIFSQVSQTFLQGAFQNVLNDAAAAHHEHVQSQIPGTPEHAAAQARAQEHAAKTKAEQDHAQQALHEAVAAAKAKAADGGSLAEQQQVFGEHMAHKIEGAPAIPTPEPHPTTPEAIEGKLANAAPHDEVHATGAGTAEELSPSQPAKDHARTGAVDEPTAVPHERREGDPVDGSAKEARRNRPERDEGVGPQHHDEQVAHKVNAVLEAMAQGGRDGVDVGLEAKPHDHIDRNTAEAIRTGAVALITKSDVVWIDDTHFIDPIGHGIHEWPASTHAMAVGDRVFVDPAAPPDALRDQLRHEVNHALHASDVDSKYGGASKERADAGASEGRFRDELRAHIAELGPDPTPAQIKERIDHILANYPEFIARHAGPDDVHNAEGLRRLLEAQPHGNTINSVRLVPVYDAIENFHLSIGEQRPTAAELHEMLGRLDAHDQKALGNDPAFQKFINEDLGLSHDDAVRVWSSLEADHAPGGAVPRGDRGATAGDDGGAKAMRKGSGDPPDGLRKPEHNTLGDEHAAAVEREAQRLEREHPGASREAILQAAREKVVADELEPGIEHDAPRPKSDKIEDLNAIAKAHEDAVAAEAKRIMDADPEAKLSIDEIMQQARKKVVDDEIALGKDVNEQARDKRDAQAKTVFGVAPTVLEPLIGKQAADGLKMIGEAVTGGKVSAKTVGEVVINAVAKGIELAVGAKLGAEAAAQVKEMLGPIKQAIKEGKPGAVEELGRLTKAGLALVKSPGDAAFVGTLVHEGLPANATHLDRMERHAQVIAAAHELQAGNPQMSRSEALAQAAEHINSLAVFDEVMRQAAKIDSDGNVDLSHIKLPPEPETIVLDPDAAARHDEREAELAKARRDRDTAAALDRMASAYGEINPGRPAPPETTELEPHPLEPPAGRPSPTSSEDRKTTAGVEPPRDGRKPLHDEDGAPWTGPTHDLSRIKVTQDSVSPATSEIGGKESIPIPELARRMRETGWRGDPIEVVAQDDGSMLSFDNRRVVAARMANEAARAAGEPLPIPDIPVKIYKPGDGFPPPTWTNPEKIDDFILKAPIRRAADGTLYTGKGPKADPIVYPKGARPTTMQEAAWFRAAKQGKSMTPARYPETGGKFPVGGSTETPHIRYPRADAMVDGDDASPSSHAS